MYISLKTFTLFSLIIFFAISLIYNQAILLFICVVIIFIFNLLYSILNFQKRIVLFAFLVTFFTFLLSKISISLLSNEGFGLPFSEETVRHIFICLFISLLFLYFGYSYSNILILRKKDTNYINTKTSRDLYFLRNVSKVIFYITYIPWLLPLMEKIIFVQKYGYAAYYLNYSQSIPFLLQKIGEMAIPSFFLFLATMPTKKEVRLPIILFLLYGIFTLGYGQRNQLVLIILILLIYSITRNSFYPKGEIWFGRSMYMLCIAIVPIFLLFLGFFAYWRQNLQMEFLAMFHIYIDFFNAQGSSVNIIGYGYEYNEIFPVGKIYTFGPIIDFLRDNIFSKVIFSFETYRQNTEEIALYGNSFGQTITYLVMPWNFTEGIGMGSCYIAEVFKDFGYIGVCLINLIYGVVLSQTNKFAKYNVWYTGVFFIMTYNILFSPRDAALTFIISSFNLINIFTFFVIYIGSRIIFTRKV